jgi:uncharacterized protein YcsI (UPF0317 family)
MFHGAPIHMGDPQVIGVDFESRTVAMASLN